MIPIKSSCPRQIEKDSDAAAPNLPIDPDHEDDTTKQGSGYDGALHLSILGSDHEDEDGDNGNHSPST
jgi:hypothetical protein